MVEHCCRHNNTTAGMALFAVTEWSSIFYRSSLVGLQSQRVQERSPDRSIPSDFLQVLLEGPRGFPRPGRICNASRADVDNVDNNMTRAKSGP